MKRNNIGFPGRIATIILIFMTLLMCFPFIFYYKYSTFSRDLLLQTRLETGSYGRNIRLYFENLSFLPENVQKQLNDIPLIDNLSVKIYDKNKKLLASRTADELNLEPEELNYYRLIKWFIDPLRILFKQKKQNKNPDTVIKALLNEAAEFRAGVDYIFKTGDAGDRILYFSYPVRDYSRKINQIKGILLLEYSDTAAKLNIQKQRNQFALMCLIFVVILAAYVFYILKILLLPLKRLLRKSLAVIERKSYLLRPMISMEKNNEIGGIDRALNNMTELLDDRETEIGNYAMELQHIIRNPLSVIRAALDGLMLDKHSERDLTFSGIIQKNLLRIDNYLNSYSGLSDIGKSFSQVEEIDVMTFMGEIIDNYTYLSKRKFISFVLKSPSGTIVWKGYRSRLFYSVEQIINNAISFSPLNGTIELEFIQIENELHISIRDEGPGIPEGEEENIFMQYYSCRKESGDKHTGTGLFLSKNVLRNMGGEISAVNRTAGGAEFTIILPLSFF